MKGHKWFAAVYDPVFSKHAEETFMKDLRPRVLLGVHGRVLEIGAGTGASLPYYKGHSFEELVISEPDPYMLERLRKKLNPDLECTIVQAPAEELPFPDASFDTVISFHVLCSVRSLPRSLSEVRRVLKPGGDFRFLDHVRSRNAIGALIQHGIQPVWSWLGAGCHPNRDIAAAVEKAGFRLTEAERLRPFGISESMVIGAVTRPHVFGVAAPVVTAETVST
jgi:ubiquinone/menaquinone biosynthesis C-methylase UbiE